MKLTWCVDAIFHGFSTAFRSCTVGLHQLVLPHGFDFVVCVDITRERDGKRDRAGKVTTVAKGNLSACEMKEDGQLAFLLN
jgi:hypothetical protein